MIVIRGHEYPNMGSRFWNGLVERRVKKNRSILAKGLGKIRSRINNLDIPEESREKAIKRHLENVQKLKPGLHLWTPTEIKKNVII